MQEAGGRRQSFDKGAVCSAQDERWAGAARKLSA